MIPLIKVLCVINELCILTSFACLFSLKAFSSIFKKPLLRQEQISLAHCKAQNVSNCSPFHD